MPRPWIDISTPLRRGMVTWPGDPPTRVRRALDMAQGDPCTVTALECCAHAGTHLDAPGHYLPGGAGIEAMPPEAALGRARVIAIEHPHRITAEELARHRIRPGQRLLFKTANSARLPGLEAFAEHFVHLELDAARFLARRRVRLVGIDALSVGGYPDGGADVHRMLLEAGVWILEGLDLSRLAPGPVELACLPLLLPGADGAPARAFARPSGRRRPPAPLRPEA